MNTIVKRHQWTPSNRMWFDDFFTREMERLLSPEGKHTHQPLSNIIESENEVKIETVLPGMTKENVQINYENGILKISASKQEDQSTEEKNYLRKEFSSVAYSRSFKVNEEKYNLEAIDAKLEHGILLISIPKRKEEKKESARKIEIK